VANEWSKDRKTRNVFYAARCYRYERRSAALSRVRAVGIEMLRRSDADTTGETDATAAKRCWCPVKDRFDISYRSSERQARSATNVVMALRHQSTLLGAQKQIAGGGILMLKVVGVSMYESS